MTWLPAFFIGIGVGAALVALLEAIEAAIRRDERRAMLPLLTTYPRHKGGRS